MKKAGFTLIELIVVITILAILGTIAFIGLKGYTSDARDSKVTTDIASLHNSLSILKAVEGILPMPENSKTVKIGTVDMTYEGEVGDNVRSTLKASQDMKTPTGENYKYAVTKDQKDFTLVGILENEVASLTTTVSAESGDNKLFKGGDVTTLFDSSDNFKEGNVLALAAGDEIYVGEAKRPLKDNKMVLDTCKQILDYGVGTTDGVYTVAPHGTAENVYCDMTTDGGGWTLTYKSKNGNEGYYENNYEVGACSSWSNDENDFCLRKYDFEMNDLMIAAFKNTDSFAGKEHRAIIRNIEPALKDYFGKGKMTTLAYYNMKNPDSDFVMSVGSFGSFTNKPTRMRLRSGFYFNNTLLPQHTTILINSHSNPDSDYVNVVGSTATYDRDSIIGVFLR